MLISRALVVVLLSIGVLDVGDRAGPAQTVLYVDKQASGPTHDGSSWCSAFTELSEALDVAATGTTIRVADGTYTPDPTGLEDSREASFQLKSGVAIQGGYAGCGAEDSDARNVDLYETVLSADLAGDDGSGPSDSDCCVRHGTPGCDNAECEAAVCALAPGCCTGIWASYCIDLTVCLCGNLCGDECENSYHVVTGSGTDESAVLDGFTITGGNADAPCCDAASRGGGMYNESGSPTVRNCLFTRNWAEASGGGMDNRANSNPMIVNCIFSWNSTNGNGGGMANEDGSSPAIIHCSFTKNGSESMSGVGGGGLYNGPSSSSTLTDCAFTQNFSYRGGAVYNVNSDPILARCLFQDNSAPVGGGGGLYNLNSDPILMNCEFRGNRNESVIESFPPGAGIFNHNSRPTLTNCIFTGNFGGPGTGMYNLDSDPTIANSTFVNNVTVGRNLTGAGGIHSTDASTPTLTSCILWGNIGTLDWPDQIAGGSVAITYSCIQEWPEPGIAGNIDDDPMFVDADGPDDIPGTEDDNLRLSLGSPCINTGDPGLIPEPGASDLDGHTRVLCGRVDMGAHEFGIADFDCNGTVDLTDFRGWSACMSGPGAGQLNPGCQAFDFDAEDDVDLADFAGFQAVMGGM